MAVPKRKTSHARKMKRRSNVWKLETPTNLVKCPQCGEFNLAYRVCKACGYYKGEQVILLVAYATSCHELCSSLTYGEAPRSNRRTRPCERAPRYAFA